MTDKEFEELWAAEGQKFLNEDPEYKKVKAGYKSSSWDWIAYIAAIVAAQLVVRTFMQVGEMLNFILTCVFALILIVVYIYIKNLLISPHTLEEIEQRVKKETREKERLKN